MNSSTYLVKVQGCPVGTVTTLGTITEVAQLNMDTYVVTFDNGESVTRHWNQTLSVVA